jgi:hypothetical protein
MKCLSSTQPTSFKVDSYRQWAVFQELEECENCTCNACKTLLFRNAVPLYGNFRWNVYHTGDRCVASLSQLAQGTWLPVPTREDLKKTRSQWRPWVMNLVLLNYKLLHHDSLVWEASSIIIATTTNQILKRKRWSVVEENKFPLIEPWRKFIMELEM